MELNLTPRDVAVLASMHITTEPESDREKYIAQRIVSHALQERLTEMREVLKAEATITRRWKLALYALLPVFFGVGVAAGRWWR